jgi:hypothetical protein
VDFLDGVFCSERRRVRGGNVYMVGMDEVDMMSVGWDVLEGKSTEGGI